MLKLRRFCLLLPLLLLLTACTGPSDSAETEPSTAPEQPSSPAVLTADDLAELVFSVDREEFAVGTGEILTLSAEGFAADGTKIKDLEIEYHCDGKKLDYPYFSAPARGFYNLYAKVGDFRSNVIEVHAKEPDAAYLEITLKNPNVLPGESITITAKALSAQGNKTTSHVSVNLNGDIRALGTQKLTEPGIYTAYAFTDSIASPQVAVAVTDEIRYELKLSADREKAKIGETVSFTAAVKKLSDGSEVPESEWSIQQIGGGETGKSFVPAEPGTFSFYVTCGGEVSNTVFVEVPDPATALPENAFTGFTSSLPAIVLDTHGSSIVPVRARKCDVYVYGSEKKGAKYGDQPTMTTLGEIKQRGQSSMGFDKKQYSLHTIDEDGSNNNVKFLGMPKENDWVLNGSYADKSLIRNGLAQTMLSKVMDYTCRTRYCELYLKNDNGALEYLGVYTLLEGIKIDNNRVDIDKLTAEDQDEPEITGGYIISLDKIKGNENTLDTQVGTLTVVKPGPDAITSRQDRYIKAYLKEFTDTIKTDKRDDPVNGVTKYVDVESFAAPLLITELLRNVDGFAISTYMYKERDGLIHYGPGWDYDLTLGSADYNDGTNPREWYVVRNSSLIRNLMRADVFSSCVVKTWKELRKDLFSDENLDRFLDDQLAMVGADCISRSCARWPNHWNGTYIWPNYNYGEHFTQTHGQEIDHMRTFLHERAAWMDRHIDELLDYPY